MADDTPQFKPQSGRGGSREPGGFRIRLSDNEMRAARAVQEAFRLRSTVAALGLALRTTAQLLEEGKLDEVVEQYRSQGPGHGEGPRGDSPRGDGPRGARRDDRSGGRQERAPRIDPFARPSKPTPAPAAPDLEPVAEAEAEAPGETAPAESVAAVETEATAE
jgi:hypothetical protein